MISMIFMFRVAKMLIKRWKFGILENGISKAPLSTLKSESLFRSPRKPCQHMFKKSFCTITTVLDGFGSSSSHHELHSGQTVNPGRLAAIKSLIFVGSKYSPFVESYHSVHDEICQVMGNLTGNAYILCIFRPYCMVFSCFRSNFPAIHPLPFWESMDFQPVFDLSKLWFHGSFWGHHPTLSRWLGASGCFFRCPSYPNIQTLILPSCKKKHGELDIPEKWR